MSYGHKIRFSSFRWSELRREDSGQRISCCARNPKYENREKKKKDRRQEDSSGGGERSAVARQGRKELLCQEQHDGTLAAASFAAHGIPSRTIDFRPVPGTIKLQGK